MVYKKGDIQRFLEYWKIFMKCYIILYELNSNYIYLK
jgi:hypothetical protein